ncbi:hypothetical protein HanPI659440_Chr11g0409561 [Helianthus annuus]|nr:hypothetical protein HanPI659440_Chr11g0409561 [Helianthus annuus]
MPMIDDDAVGAVFGCSTAEEVLRRTERRSTGIFSTRFVHLLKPKNHLRRSAMIPMDDDVDDFSCCVQKEGVHFDPEVKYANHPDLFTLKVHHGGDFTDEDDFEYGGGKVFKKGCLKGI